VIRELEGGQTLEINCDELKQRANILLKKTKIKIIHITDLLSYFVIPIGLVGLFLLSFYFVCVTATYVAITSGQQPAQFFKKVTDYAFLLFRVETNELDAAKYSSIVTIVLNTSIMLITTWFAIVPLFTYWRFRSNLRKSSSFQVYPIFNDGVDDIAVMNKYFDGADTLTIYSGDFSFLPMNEQMKALCLTLANKGRLKLVSYKPEHEISKSLEESFFNYLKSKNAIVSGSDKRIKCSYISYRSSSIFLYKYDFHGNNGREIYVCAVKETRDSRYLLDTLNALCQT